MKNKIWRRWQRNLVKLYISLQWRGDINWQINTKIWCGVMLDLSLDLPTVMSSEKMEIWFCKVKITIMYHRTYLNLMSGKINIHFTCTIHVPGMGFEQTNLSKSGHQSIKRLNKQGLISLIASCPGAVRFSLMWE